MLDQTEMSLRRSFDRNLGREYDIAPMIRKKDTFEITSNVRVFIMALTGLKLAMVIYLSEERSKEWEKERTNERERVSNPSLPPFQAIYFASWGSCSLSHILSSIPSLPLLLMKRRWLRFIILRASSSSRWFWWGKQKEEEWINDSLVLSHLTTRLWEKRARVEDEVSGGEG